MDFPSSPFNIHIISSSVGNFFRRFLYFLPSIARLVTKNGRNPSMSVFALQADIFYEYVVVLMEYGVFKKSVFSKFCENISMCKYLYKNVLSCKNLHTYAAVHISSFLITPSV